jgi:hypothetical protein
VPPPPEIANDQLDTFLTNRLLAMIEETLLAMIDVGVTFETYAAALVPILIGAASALSDVTDTELVPSTARGAEQASKVRAALQKYSQRRNDAESV